MIAIEVFLTVVVLVLVGLLLVLGAATLLGKRLHLDEWFRRDRRRLELYLEQQRKQEQEHEAARAEACSELEKQSIHEGEEGQEKR